MTTPTFIAKIANSGLLTDHKQAMYIIAALVRKLNNKVTFTQEDMNAISYTKLVEDYDPMERVFTLQLIEKTKQ